MYKHFEHFEEEGQQVQGKAKLWEAGVLMSEVLGPLLEKHQERPECHQRVE